jgi:hypothetical protein
MLGVIVFRAWMQPLPNPATNGPIPDNGWFSALMLGGLMAVPLAALSLPLFATGLGYLRRAMLNRRWRVAWVSAAMTAAAVEITFLGIFVGSSLPVPFGPQQNEWVMLVISAGFVVAGTAMVAVITTASREARPGVAVSPAPDA